MKRFILLALFASCACFATGPTTKAKGALSQNWSVTIDDTLSDGTPTMIQSDGGGPYINGVAGVTLNLSSGVINFWPGTRSGTRNVSFSNGGPYQSLTNQVRTDLPAPTDYLTPPTGMTGTGQALVFPRAAGPGGATPVENMAVNSSQCGHFWWAITESSTGDGWRVPNFHYNEANVPESSYVVVTRVDSTHWTVESDQHGTCGAPNSVGMVLHGETVKGQTTTYADGYYYVPFHLTYTLQ
jgi:hypothetical protein